MFFKKSHHCSFRDHLQSSNVNLPDLASTDLTNYSTPVWSLLTLNFLLITTYLQHKNLTMKVIGTVKDLVQDQCYLISTSTGAIIVISNHQELKLETSYLFMNPTKKLEKIFLSNPKVKAIAYKNKEVKAIDPSEITYLKTKLKDALGLTPPTSTDNVEPRVFADLFENTRAESPIKQLVAIVTRKSAKIKAAYSDMKIITLKDKTGDQVMFRYISR